MLPDSEHRLCSRPNAPRCCNMSGVGARLPRCDVPYGKADQTDEKSRELTLVKSYFSPVYRTTNNKLLQTLISVMLREECTASL